MQSVFDFQRSIIEQNQTFTRDMIEAQQSAMDASVDSLDLFRRLATQNVAFARTLANASLENMQLVLGDDFEGFEEAQQMVDEQFDQIEVTTEETVELTDETIEEATEAYEAFTTAYLDAMDVGIETYLEALEDVETVTEDVAEQIEIEG